MIPQLGLQKCTLELWTISQMILHIFWGQLEIKTAASIHTFVTVSSVVFAYGASNDPCVFVIFADWMQVALEIDACATDVTSLGWGGVGMLTFMLTCVTCTTDVTSLGWGGVGMLTFMLTCVTCTTDVTSLGWGGVGMLTFMLTCVHNWRLVTGLGWGC